MARDTYYTDGGLKGYHGRVINITSNIVIENRAAKHNYFIEDTVECGIELWGHEVKSVRCGMASIKEAWIAVENGELILKQMHITKWDTSFEYGIQPTRERKLLAHKSEIRKMNQQVQRDGYTLVPLKVYFNKRGKCKVLVGICKGKHDYDKRETIKNRDIKRDMQRSLKDY